MTDRPKALVEVAGEPFLFHQLRLLRSHNARRIVLCVGHLGDQIANAVGDGKAFDLEIEIVSDPPELAGTAGAVRGALPHLGDEFFVLYGDTYLKIDYAAAGSARRSAGTVALMTVLRNAGRWDTSNATFEDGRVLRYDKRAPDPSMEWIDYGLAALTPAALDRAPQASDLAEVYRELAEEGQLAGYPVTQRFYEVGTPAGRDETDAELRRQLAAAG